MNELLELNKPYVLFVERDEGTGYTRAFKDRRAALRRYDIEASRLNNDELPARMRNRRVWVTYYAHVEDHGVELVSYTYP